MTVATYTSDLTDIFLFESTTGVSAWNITGGGGASLGASPDYAVQGTNAVDKQISASEKGFMHDNVTAHVLSPNDHYFVWITLAVYGLAATRDNRGICVCIGDGTSDYVQYHVNGSDTLPLGGVVPYAIRHDNSALTNRRTITGSPSTTPDHIGSTASVTGTAKFSNLGVDAARFGTGYDILGGTSADPEATFAGIASDDESTAEGVFQTTAGGFKLQGKLRIGNSGTECELLDLNTNIFLVENLSGHTQSDFSEILVSDDLSIFTLTNVNIIALGPDNPGRFEMLKPLITAQDETSYDNSPTTEGTFAAGTGYSVSDVILLDDLWTEVTVDTLSGSAVATFTVNSTRGRTATAGVTLAQDSVLPTGGSGFTLTPDVDNIISDFGTVAFTNVGFIDFGETILDNNATMAGCRWIGADQVIGGGASLLDCSILTSIVAANEGSLFYDQNTDPDGELDGMIFEQGSTAHHAIEFGVSTPTTITLRNMDFTGFSSSDDNDGSIFRFNNTSDSITLNLVGCSHDGSGFTVDDRAGSTVTVVLDPRTATFVCLDGSTTPPSAIENARVLIEAADGAGDLPFEDVVTLTQTGGTVTAAHTAHGMADGDLVVIREAVESEYNGTFPITNSTANDYDYIIQGNPSSPATGTILASGAVVFGLTDSNGEIADTRTWTSSQVIKGTGRKKTSEPVYETGNFTGTISNAADTTLTSVMQPD